MITPEMANRKLKLQFLRKNNIKKKFENNVYLRVKAMPFNISHKEVLNWLYDEAPLDTFLAQSFSWRLSPEKHQYWYEMNKKWLKFIAIN